LCYSLHWVPLGFDWFSQTQSCQMEPILYSLSLMHMDITTHRPYPEMVTQQWRDSLLLLR
jgi:hypothetical protein